MFRLFDAINAPPALTTRNHPFHTFIGARVCIARYLTAPPPGKMIHNKQNLTSHCFPGFKAVATGMLPCPVHLPFRRYHESFILRRERILDQRSICSNERSSSDKTPSTDGWSAYSNSDSNTFIPHITETRTAIAFRTIGMHWRRCFYVTDERASSGLSRGFC